MNVFKLLLYSRLFQIVVSALIILVLLIGVMSAQNTSQSIYGAASIPATIDFHPTITVQTTGANSMVVRKRSVIEFPGSGSLFVDPKAMQVYVPQNGNTTIIDISRVAFTSNLMNERGVLGAISITSENGTMIVWSTFPITKTKSKSIDGSVTGVVPIPMDGCKFEEIMHFQQFNPMTYILDDGYLVVDVDGYFKNGTFSNYTPCTQLEIPGAYQIIHVNKDGVAFGNP